VTDLAMSLYFAAISFAWSKFSDSSMIARISAVILGNVER
jgi:hypothetical protein